MIAPEDVKKKTKGTQAVAASTEETCKSDLSAVSDCGHPGPFSVSGALPEPSEEAIRFKAYLLWEAAGSPQGECESFWLKAREELLSTANA